MKIELYYVVNLAEGIEIYSKNHSDWGNSKIKNINSKNYTGIVLEKRQGKAGDCLGGIGEDMITLQKIQMVSLVEFHDNKGHCLIMIWVPDKYLVIKK